MLPDSFVLTDVVKTSGHAISGGGFADIHLGSHAGKEVALKVLRVYGRTQANQKKVIRVGV